MWPTAILQSISAALVGEKKKNFFFPFQAAQKHTCLFFTFKGQFTAGGGLT